MKCQLVSTLEVGRRERGIYAYPVIWARAVSRYLRWYLSLAGHAFGMGTAERTRPSRGDTYERRIEAGDWVRVKSRSEIEALQKGADLSDVVAFIPAPMSRYCGRTLRVLRILEHYYDEVREGFCKAENAVLLEGATCDSSQLGGRHCDRGCLHFWKESWLDPVTDTRQIPGDVSKRESVKFGMEPSAGKPASSNPEARIYGLKVGAVVRVRDLSSIAKTLDTQGVCEGVPFIPEHMAGYCGRVFIVSRKISHFFDEKADYMIRLPQAYLLSGVRCSGHQTGDEARCDRGCTLVWHQAWLERLRLESAGGEDGTQGGV